MSDRCSIGIALFDGFELLDVFGPLEKDGIAADHFDICLVAEQADSVTSRKEPRSVIDNQTLLARTGLLDGMSATINKLAFEWVASQSSRVNWQRQAQWAEYDWHRDADWDPFAKLQGMPEALSSC